MRIAAGRILESGIGWLPFWAERMDDQAVYMGYLSEDVEHRASREPRDDRHRRGRQRHRGQDEMRG